jgi:hypothetical protein
MPQGLRGDFTFRGLKKHWYYQHVVNDTILRGLFDRMGSLVPGVGHSVRFRSLLFSDSSCCGASGRDVALNNDAFRVRRYLGDERGEPVSSRPLDLP